MERKSTAITMGDPAGVGPELCLRALSDPEVLSVCNPVVFGNMGVLERVARECGLPLPSRAQVVDCCDIDAAGIEPGVISAECGKAAYECIAAAVKSVRSGEASAVVTAPIHKEALKLAGIEHPGHTEILAELTGTESYCMMMASEKIIVTLSTIHIGLKDVPEELNSEDIFTAIKLTDDLLKRIGRDDAEICVCGLNPHAGEGGIFGDEEAKVIMPAVKAAREEGIFLTDPLPPDTAFIGPNLERFGAFVVMYHDQGLIPFKMTAFDEGVNITLGLPIVRTSVDHGTAFDIAWQGKASHRSLVEAVRWAARIA